jgi:hypothetical protein
MCTRSYFEGGELMDLVDSYDLQFLQKKIRPGILIYSVLDKS